jgi:hypothetical protein
MFVCESMNPFGLLMREERNEAYQRSFGETYWFMKVKRQRYERTDSGND